MLPQSLMEPLRRQLEQAERLHQDGLAAGFRGFTFPTLWSGGGAADDPYQASLAAPGGLRTKT
jgi:hypothetical protein